MSRQISASTSAAEIDISSVGRAGTKSPRMRRTTAWRAGTWPHTTGFKRPASQASSKQTLGAIAPRSARAAPPQSVGLAPRARPSSLAAPPCLPRGTGSRAARRSNRLSRRLPHRPPGLRQRPREHGASAHGGCPAAQARPAAVPQCGAPSGPACSGKQSARMMGQGDNALSCWNRCWMHGARRVERAAAV